MTQADVTTSVPPQFLAIRLHDSGQDMIPLHQRACWPARQGDVIAVLTPTPPEPGLSRPTAVPLEELKLGKNVAWTPEHNAVLAMITGQITLNNSVLDVSPKLEIPGELTAASGPIDFPGDILIRKNVADGVHLHAAGNVTVDGSIEAANVTAAADLVVHHGICSKEKGSVVAKNVHARFSSNARIHAHENAAIDNEVNNCRIICGGQFNSPNASILSSHITAVAGIACHTAGSSAQIKTVLELSLDAAELNAAEKAFTELKSLQKIASRIRESVEPLMKNPKVLTPQQKEKATDLLFQADEAEAKAQALSVTLSEPRKKLAATAQAPMRIQGVLHAGVIIRFPGVEATIREPLKGPLMLVLKSSPAETCIAVTDMHRRPMTTIPATLTPQHALIKQLQNQT